MTVRAAGKHPITEGLAEFPIVDEVYNFMWRSPRSRVLLEADKPEGEKAVAWSGPCQKSRVVVIQRGIARKRTRMRIIASWCATRLCGRRESE